MCRGNRCGDIFENDGDWLARQLGMGNRANVSRAVKEIEEAKDEPVVM
jgi:hypothetical protein